MTHFLDPPVRPGLDIDLALHAMLQRAFAGTDVRVGIDFPGKDRLPSVSALRGGGLADWPDGQLERPRVDITSYALTRHDSINLTLEVVAFLRSSEGEVVTFGDGVRMLFGTVEDVAGLFTAQDDSGAFQATYTVEITVQQLTPTPTR